MSWFLYAVGPAGLEDGPWEYDDEGAARDAFQRYSARVAAQSSALMARRESAETLDALIAAHPGDFVGPTARQTLRTARDLAKVDRRVRMFTSMGLAAWAPMTDSDALVLAQQRLRALRLDKRVPEVVVRHFEALCELQLYGSFAYDFFAMVLTLTSLAHELVLGAKFVDVYAAQVPLVRARGAERAILEVTSFRRLVDAMERDGSHPHEKGWRLEGHESFRPTLGGLIRWAVDREMFHAWLEAGWRRARWAVISVDLGRNPPQRWKPMEYDGWSEDEQSRWWDTAGRARWERERLKGITGLRNLLDHPSSHNVLSPVDGIRALQGLAEFINVLWPARDAEVAPEED